MNVYSIALFVHFVSTLVFFVALGLEWIGSRQIRRVTPSEQVRVWMRILNSARKIGFASMLTTVLSGIYMMATVWGPVAWIIVTMVSLVLLIALSLALTGPRMAAVGRALAKETGQVSQTFQSLAHQPLLWISIQTRVAITLGIVVLKTARPEIGGSLLILGVAIVLGLALSLPLPRRERAQEVTAK